MVLAERLRGAADIGAALRGYESARFAKTAMVTRVSRRFGAVGHWENPLACRVRDAAMAIIPRGVLLRQQRALMSFSV